MVNYMTIENTGEQWPGNDYTHVLNGILKGGSAIFNCVLHSQLVRYMSVLYFELKYEMQHNNLTFPSVQFHIWEHVRAGPNERRFQILDGSQSAKVLE